MNHSIAPTESPAHPALRPAFVGISVALAVIAAVALTQWAFAPQFTDVLDWQQTAVAIYAGGIGTLGCLLILPGLISDAGRTE